MSYFDVIKKLHKIIASGKYNSVIKWCYNGSAFCIWESESINSSGIFAEIGGNSLKDLFKILKSYKFSCNLIESDSGARLTVFKNRYFKKSKDDLLKLLDIEPKRNTFHQLKMDALSPSLFNIKVIESLNRILECLRILERNSQFIGPKNLKTGIKILICEQNDTLGYMPDIVSKIRNEGFLVDLTFLYNEFDTSVRSSFYDVIIIDYDLYYVYQKLSFNIDLDRFKLLITINRKYEALPGNYLFIEKPYDARIIIKKIQDMSRKDGFS